MLLLRSKSDIVPLTQREVSPERVTIMEELGRGAFGKVRKGFLKELPNPEVFFKPREEREDINEGRVVAIKVLLGKQINAVDLWNRASSMCAPKPRKLSKLTVKSNIFYP